MNDLIDHFWTLYALLASQVPVPLCLGRPDHWATFEDQAYSIKSNKWYRAQKSS
jgi:hypothetical protein